MKIFERVRDIIINPKVTWQVIKDESIEIKQLFVNYIAPLALIPVVCGMIGMTIVGIRMPAGNVVRAPFMELLLAQTVGYVLGLAGILLGAWVIKLLAPYFGAKADLPAALKVAAFSMTPFWLAGIFSLVPGLAILSLLGFYGIYLFVLGLRTVLDTPPNKIALYTVSILVIGFFLSLILNVVIGGLFYGPMYMRMMAA